MMKAKSIEDQNMDKKPTGNSKTTNKRLIAVQSQSKGKTKLKSHPGYINPDYDYNLDPDTEKEEFEIKKSMNEIIEETRKSTFLLIIFRKSND